MEQLILRQAAIDALRTCYDTETIIMDNGDEYINYGDAVGEIEQLPPAQPEIIQCKDCAWWTKQEDSTQGRCALLQIYPTGEWFCGNAGRREVTT